MRDLNNEWTKEYCNMTYLGRFSTKTTWVSVCRHKTHAMLYVYFPGCQFSPKEYLHRTVDEAKEHGEKILKKMHIIP